jgi:hypothetical protein
MQVPEVDVVPVGHGERPYALDLPDDRAKALPGQGRRDAPIAGWLGCHQVEHLAVRVPRDRRVGVRVERGRGEPEVAPGHPGGVDLRGQAAGPDQARRVGPRSLAAGLDVLGGSGGTPCPSRGHGEPDVGVQALEPFFQRSAHGGGSRRSSASRTRGRTRTRRTRWGRTAARAGRAGPCR